MKSSDFAAVVFGSAIIVIISVCWVPMCAANPLANGGLCDNCGKRIIGEQFINNTSP